MDVDLQEAGSSRARRASASSSAKYNPAKRRNSRSSTAYDDEDEDVPPGYTVSRTLDGDDHADSHAALLGTTEDDDDDTGKFSEDGHRPRPALSQHPSQIATVEQRKALWWKNVFITGIFVLLWSVCVLVLYFQCLVKWQVEAETMQVRLRDTPLIIQQMDVLPSIL